MTNLQKQAEKCTRHTAARLAALLLAALSGLAAPAWAQPVVVFDDGTAVTDLPELTQPMPLYAASDGNSERDDDWAESLLASPGSVASAQSNR